MRRSGGIAVGRSDNLDRWSKDPPHSLCAVGPRDGTKTRTDGRRSHQGGGSHDLESVSKGYPFRRCAFTPFVPKTQCSSTPRILCRHSPGIPRIQKLSITKESSISLIEPLGRLSLRGPGRTGLLVCYLLAINSCQQGVRW